MSSLNFPASPSKGDDYTAAGITYTYDGTKWVTSGFSPTYVRTTGDTMTGPLSVPAASTRGEGNSEVARSSEINPYLAWAYGVRNGSSNQKCQNAVITGGSGTSLNTGVFKVTFNEQPPNANYTILLSIGGDTTTRRTINYDSGSNKRQESFIVRIKDSAGTSKDGVFSFVVFPYFGD